MVFEQLLLKVYREFPCRTLPNAFWKTVRQLDSSQLEIQRDSKDVIQSLTISQKDRLLAFWCSEPNANYYEPEMINTISFALVHQDALPIFSYCEFSRRQAFFRLVHQGKPQIFSIPVGFAFENVNPKREMDDVVGVIRACYQQINVNKKIAQNWLDHAVYDPNLWVWVLEKDTGIKAGLGIAEFDSKVPEASLEWIQITPAYQGRGLAKALVSELLRRCTGKVAFTTVSGEMDNYYQPEQLYRRCGFTGEDIWWLLST